MMDKHGDFSPFAYCYNNPINLIDPFGLDTVPAGQVSFGDFNLQNDVIDFGSSTNNYVGNNTESYSQSNSGNQENGNDKIGLTDLRNLFPVAKTYGVDIDIVSGPVGATLNPISIGIILQGDDFGKAFTFGDFSGPTNFHDASKKSFVGWAIGWDQSVGIAETNVFYTGNIKDFKIESFNGKRWSAEGAISVYGVDLGGQIYISEPDRQGGRLIGIGAIVGVGGSGGNINKGETSVYKIIKQ